MSFLRGSLNYVWCTTSVLGKGATGAVFQVWLMKFFHLKQTINGTYRCYISKIRCFSHLTKQWCKILKLTMCLRVKLSVCVHALSCRNTLSSPWAHKIWLIRGEHNFFSCVNKFFVATGSKQTQWGTRCSENIQSNESYETRWLLLLLCWLNYQ